MSDNITLEALGITKDDLVNRIVSAALGMAAGYKQTGEESWADVPLSSVVDAKITEAIGNLVDTMKPLLQQRIDEIMTTKITEVFTAPFTPTDRWGKPKGEPTTIRDMIADEAESYWAKTVGSDGKQPSDGYGEKMTRAQYYARQVMTDVYNEKLVQEVKTMASELRAKIPATISAEISETVLNHLRR